MGYSIATNSRILNSQTPRENEIGSRNQEVRRTKGLRNQLDNFSAVNTLIKMNVVVHLTCTYVSFNSLKLLALFAATD